MINIFLDSEIVLSQNYVEVVNVDNIKEYYCIKFFISQCNTLSHRILDSLLKLLFKYNDHESIKNLFIKYGYGRFIQDNKFDSFHSIKAFLYSSDLCYYVSNNTIDNNNIKYVCINDNYYSYSPDENSVAFILESHVDKP